jgi:CheY-like chemotaxis protein
MLAIHPLRFCVSSPHDKISIGSKAATAIGGVGTTLLGVAGAVMRLKWMRNKTLADQSALINGLVTQQNEYARHQDEYIRLSRHNADRIDDLNSELEEAKKKLQLVEGTAASLGIQNADQQKQISARKTEIDGLSTRIKTLEDEKAKIQDQIDFMYFEVSRHGVDVGKLNLPTDIKLCGRALLVEDDPKAQFALAGILKYRGCTVVTASTVQAAMAALASEEFDTILLDLMLPDGTGVEILRHVRKSRMKARVALMTGSTGHLLAEAKGLNPDMLFPKPLDVTSLTEWMGAHHPRN